MSETKSTTKARVHVINLENEIDEDEIEEMSNPETIKIVNQSIRDQLRRGDLVALSEERYRNDGVWIWNGNSVEALDYDIDDYGSVPESYRVTADGPFTPDYWLESVDHNCIVHLDSDLLTGVKPGDTLTIQGKDWPVVLDEDSASEDKDSSSEDKDSASEDNDIDLTSSEWYFECIEGQLVAKKKVW